MMSIPEEWKNRERTPLDFIVIGAGAGGAPLAARLVERGYTVLVVEMGPEKPSKPADAVVENTEVPLLHSETTEDARHSLRFFVKHFDDDPKGSQDPKIYTPPPDARRDEEGIFYPRAQGVGGCTVHNAMITICGPSEDWDEIAEATGDESWRGERMRAYFERLEQCEYARPTWWARFKGLLGLGTGWENARHGERGWLRTTLSDLRFLKQDHRLLRVVLGGLLGTLRAGAANLGELLSSLLRGRAFPSLDPNHWETMRRGGEGLARIPCAISASGERSGPRERLLNVKADPAHGHRLHLLTGACVTEIVFEGAPNPVATEAGELGPRATGIRYLPQEHAYEADPNAVLLKEAAKNAPIGDENDWRRQLVELHCQREVILCGGAFNTPQLLMLSGIGPEDHLRELGIPLRVERPGVGLNLQDRYEVPVIATVTDRFRSLDGLALSSRTRDPKLEQWIRNKGRSAFQRGLYATNGGLIGIFLRTQEEDASPDLFIFALAGNFPGYSVGWSRPSALVGLPPETSEAEILRAPHRVLTWIILKARTRHHQGCVRLQSAHPFRRPVIDFRSFPLASDKDLDRKSDSSPGAPGEGFLPSRDLDLEALAQGVGFVQDILNIGKEKKTIERYELPGFDRFEGNVRKWIKHIAWGHHACGTCRIGADRNDPTAVLDSRFRVLGVRGLRVVDASAFPRIPGFFLVANVYMIAEKAADVLSEDNPLPAAKITSEVKAALKLDPVLPSRPEFEARRLYPAEMEAVEADRIAARRNAAGL